MPLVVEHHYLLFRLAFVDSRHGDAKDEGKVAQDQEDDVDVPSKLRVKVQELLCVADAAKNDHVKHRHA